MTKDKIQVGCHYVAKIGDKLTTVRVDKIETGYGDNGDCTEYSVTNLRTGRKITFRSAAKFRAKADPGHEAIAFTPEQKIELRKQMEMLGKLSC